MPKTDTNDLELGVTIRGVAAEQKLFGRYTLRKVLGRGGMGIVWLAHDDELKRNVAMKFLPDMIIRDREAVEDLKRETRRSLDLTHHHIVRIYDFTQDDTCAAIVMEYVDGDSLSALKTHQTTGCFGVSALQVWAGHFCQALDYAHRQARVVHRDLKPANLMVNSRGDLKVTDFGISRSMSDSMTRVSISNSAGTLAYMSPEQALGAPPAIGDDIYAFGATIYDLLSGRPPFFRGNLQVQLETVIPPPMEARRTELGNSGEPIPALWEEVIAACLAKRPQDRPRSMAEIATLLGIGGSSSSGTGVSHGGFGGSIGTSRTSFAPGTSTTDRTISPEEMVTAQVRSKPSTSAGLRPPTSGTPPVPTRAEDVFLNWAPARTPTAPPSSTGAPSTSSTAPRTEPPVQPTPTNRVTPVTPPTPVPPAEKAAPAKPIPAPEAVEVPAAVPKEIVPEPITPAAVVPEPAAAPAVPAAAPAVEETPEPVALKPSAPAAPSAAESEVPMEPMTIPAVARKNEPAPPTSPEAEEADAPVEKPHAEAAPSPAPIQRLRIPEPPKPFPAPGVPPYQGVGHMIGTSRKKSAAPWVAAGIGALVLIGGLTAFFVTRDTKPAAKIENDPGQAPVVAPRVPVPTESETLTARANELLEEGKLQDAKLELSRALALDPNNSAAAALETQLDQRIAEEKKRADLEAKNDVLKRIDAALRGADYFGAKQLIETVPGTHASDADVVSKKAEIEGLEANARVAAMAQKKAEDDQRIAADKAAADAAAEAKRIADAEEKDKEREQARIAAANRKKREDEERAKKKPATTAKKRQPENDSPPPSRPRVVQTPPAPPPSRPPPQPQPKNKWIGPGRSTAF